MALVSKWSLANPIYRILSWTGILLILYVFFKIISFFHVSCCCFWGIVVAVVIGESMRDKLKIEPDGKAVLITGCDSGFGLHFSEHLLKNGFLIISGVLDMNSDGAKYLQELSPKRLIVVKLDVKSDKEVQDAVSTVSNITAEKKSVLWAIVNNAGVSRTGPFEFLPMEDHELTFRVNVLGAMRVSKMFLPLMRRSKGRFINVTSAVRIAGSGFCSPYSVSKFAAEGLAQCMRYELQHMGIKVICVEPSFFVNCTNLTRNTHLQELIEDSRKNLTEEQSQFYNAKYFSMLRDLEQIMKTAGHKSDDLMMEALELSICSRYPSSKYLATDFLGSALYIMSFLPDILYRQFD